MHAPGQSPVTLPKVEAGLVGNHNMVGLRIARAKLFREEPIAIQVRRRQLQTNSSRGYEGAVKFVKVEPEGVVLAVTR